MSRRAARSRHGTHKRRPYRHWTRRLLVGANVFVALCLVSTGTVYAYVQSKVGSIKTQPAPHLTKPPGHSPDSSAGLASENILLIGNQTRAGLGTTIYGSPTDLAGSLSDVIMVLHLDPSKQSASILSIPRDLFVPQPAGSPVGPYQKIDAALNDGAKGPDNLVQAITSDLGIPINHFVELNFNGFQGTVNAVGGINMNFPEPVYDSYSGLNIKTTGCQHLNGAEALALVRARHLQYDPPGVSPGNHSAWPYDPESDLSRIVRDHAFVRELVSTAMSQGVTNPFKVNGFIDGIISQITVDPGLRDQLVTLATHYRHLNPTTAPQTTLPVNQVGDASGYSYAGAAIGDVEFANQPLDNQVIAAWDADALPAPVTPVAVEVENVTNSPTQGGDTAAGLRAAGLPVTTVTQGEVASSTSPTWVDYPPEQVADGLAVLNQLQGSAMLRPVPSLPLGTVNVEVGSAVAVATAATSPPTPAAGSSLSSPPTTVVPGTVQNLRGGTALDPTPSSSSDNLKAWDPRPC
ncbi:MAG: LCP family protein [Actinomycetota bacterium]|nr:LCP family protein [Actinomycetota bacterium]